MTAAGTVPPAKVLVLGAGVAGLQAIATARRLGAVTSAYDVRPSSADEVKSLGATFLSLELETQEGVGGYARAQSEDFLAQQRQLLLKHVGESDAVITTAAVPGRRAPLLVTTEMVEQMREGSVIVDLAAETGGNCELTRPGEEIVHHGVTVYGPRNVPSELSRHASELFSRNVTNLLLLMTKDEQFAPDFTDDVLAGCCVTRDGDIVHPVAREALGEPEPVTTAGARTGSPSETDSTDAPTDTAAGEPPDRTGTGGGGGGIGSGVRKVTEGSGS
jgi:NAD(P) transhydrogenase subunit alpha